MKKIAIKSKKLKHLSYKIGEFQLRNLVTYLYTFHSTPRFSIVSLYLSIGTLLYLIYLLWHTQQFHSPRFNSISFIPWGFARMRDSWIILWFSPTTLEGLHIVCEYKFRLPKRAWNLIRLVFFLLVLV